ncbi:hypothetical protein BUALT_Bualt08G0042900 [Buddleja alternifolia]|uniref:Uncharacterized protein n=1 Tax=Buddleja alternifolia TaxID=168488 RepID=A0AAV6X2Z6_9LAMI|nr:hypothetical protein BUALT_Bualt08G0042900 [Buddleja alternifolia]
MKSFGLLFVFLFIGTAAFMYLGYSSNNNASNPGNVSAMTLSAKSRKLKDNVDSRRSNEDDTRHVSLEDYRPIDPSPSSKASIRPGPIQHGTPLMPYIPRPSPPPTQPKHG